MKTCGQDEYIGLDQDVLKKSSEDEDERHLQDVLIKTNVWWESFSFKFWKYILKTLKFFKKNNASKKRSIKIFFNEILRLKPTNNKKQVVKQNTDEFKYEGDTRTSGVEEIENEAEVDDDDDDDDDDDGDTSQHLEKRTEFIGSILEVMDRWLSIESTWEIAGKLKSSRVEAKEIPSKENIVQIKANVPRGHGKLGRSSNLLYPIECESIVNDTTDRFELGEDMFQEKAIWFS